MSRKFQGFTIIELVVVLSVAAVAVSLALGSWRSVADRHELVSSTEQVSTFLVTAQSEAIKRNSSISLSFNRSGDTDWCFGTSLGDEGCDCTVTDAGDTGFCAIDSVEQRLEADWLGQFRLLAAGDQAPTSGDERVVFDSVRGILDPPGDKLELAFSSNSGKYLLNLSIGPTGILDLCYPSESATVNGYSSCP